MIWPLSHFGRGLGEVIGKSSEAATSRHVNLELLLCKAFRKICLPSKVFCLDFISKALQCKKL